MDPILSLRFRRAGAPRVTALGRLPAAANAHRLALSLGAAVLHERGGLGEGEEPAWSVVPLAERGTLVSREACTVLRWQGLGAENGRSLGVRGLDHLRVLLDALAVERPDAPPEHAGGLSLMLGYDLAQEIEELPCTTEDRDGLPWLHAVAHAAALLVHEPTGECRLAWLPDAEPGAPASALAWGLDEEEADELEARVRAALAGLAAREPAAPEGRPLGPPEALTGREEYEAMVRAVIEHLHAGNLYQANVSQRFEAPWQGSLLPLHERLREADPSPHAGWLRAPGWELVSNSPERMVRLRGRDLLTEPIGGTRPLPQGPSTAPEEVAALSGELEAATKDRAEHVMLVDIHRNDLARVAVPGSVRVPRMMRVDRRRHVLQAVAEIRAELASGKGPVDVIEAFLPAGCITGVPKVRCLQVLDELERWRRGPYTGSFGRIAAWGDLDLNVLIRSAWRTRGHAAFQAGGGIVLDSEPEAEWRESLAKARSLDEAFRSLLPPGERGPGESG